MPGLICPLCPYERTSSLNLDLTNFLRHIELFHSHQPSFNITCGLGGCLRNFKNFRVFRNHVYAFHNNDPGLISTIIDTIESDNEQDIEDLDVHDAVVQNSAANSSNVDTLQMSSALFLMGMKEKYKLTQVLSVFHLGFFV